VGAKRANCSAGSALKPLPVVLQLLQAGDDGASGAASSAGLPDALSGWEQTKVSDDVMDFTVVCDAPMGCVFDPATDGLPASLHSLV
jgi:hypothetical protein